MESSEQNELTNKIEREREQADSYQREGRLQGWVKKVKVIRPKTNKQKTPQTQGTVW